MGKWTTKKGCVIIAPHTDFKGDIYDATHIIVPKVPSVLLRCYCVFPTDSLIHYNDVIMSVSNGVSNQRPCLLNRLFKVQIKKTSKLRVTGLCEGNPAVTGDFPAQGANNAQNISIWWRHYVLPPLNYHIVPQLQCGILRSNTGLHNEAWIKWKELCWRHYDIRFWSRTVVLWSKFKVHY